MNHNTREDVPDESAPLPRTIGFLGTALIPVNGMIGAGIFALPAIMVAAVGNFAPWMMLIGALLMLPLTLAFALLATRFDRHGGPVLYTHAAFGPFIGFQTGWSRYASGVVAIAANTKVAVAYLAVLFPVLDSPLAQTIAAVAFIAFITGLNLVGMRASVTTLGLMTVIKLTPLVLLVVLGLTTREPAIGFSLPEFSAVESVVLLSFYAYMAIENGTFAAGELRNPRRNVPLALIATLAATALFYMLIIWAYLAIEPSVQGNESALAAAAGELLGELGVILISVAAACSIAANTLAGGIVTPRMTFAMAEQGVLPPIFAHVSPRFRTPDFSILFYGALAILFSLWGGFAVLAVASILVRLVMYFLTSMALPVLEYREEGTAFAWWHIPLAMIAAGASLWVASQASADAFRVFALIFLAGTGLYFVAARNSS